MGEHIREWLGLKKLDDAVGDRVAQTNARMGAVISLLTAVFEIVMIAMMIGSPEATMPPGYDPGSWVRGHLISYFCLLAAAILLFVCSVLVIRGKAKSHWAIRVPAFVFDVAALAFGIYISSIDYMQGRLILVFASMVVMCSCLFIVMPVVTIVIDTVAFLVFFAVISGASSSSAVVVINLIAFWLVTLVVSIVRFNEKRRAEQAQFEVTEQSMHDVLTGLKNRRSLNADFEQVEQGDYALVMLDVDDFKFFNDAYGHAVGDSVLVQFADALRASFPLGSCYRSGGDEFLVFEADPGDSVLREKLRDLHDSVHDIHLDGENLFVSSSVGVVVGHVEGFDDLQGMLSVADIAMYEAKRRGKDRVAFRNYDAAKRAGELTETPRELAYKVEEADPLTGLPNYTHFRNRAMRVLRDPKGYVGGVAFVYFDIANFKAFNHEYGYEGGDSFLQSVATVLKDVFKGQLVARFGEDRFVVLADRDHVIERVIDAHERAHGYQRDVTLELKAGICYPDENETDISTLYDRAKLACDSIKAEFDQVYRVYDNRLDVATIRRDHIVNSIDAAIENGWIKVFYQPVMRTQTRKLCGVEALARWADPELGMISPAEFVDVLEQHHLINKLDIYMIEHICRSYRKVLEWQIPPVPVSVNLSRLDFELCDIFEVVESTTAKYSIPRSMLHLEVTESALTDNSELIKEQIRRFREAGYQVWMDDFGSGYSSLNLLKEYEFDVLKIDMLFLRGLEEHEESRVIISSIVDMAKQLGIQTLAEGVETEGQLEFLSEIGCEKLQGYLFSKPRPHGEIIQMIASGELPVELMDDRRYYTETGKVNIIGRSPGRSGRDADDSAGVLPLAMVECREGVFHYLSANHAYKHLMEKLDIGSLQAAERRLNGDFEKALLTFRQICRKVKQENGTRSLDHITHGSHCNTRITYIASNRDEADAFLLCTISDVDLTKTAEEATLQEALRFIFSVYARVDVIAEDNSLMENIYLNSGQYEGEFVHDDVKTSLVDYANRNVHPDDRMRFMDYYDTATMQRRLEAHRLSHLSAFFRTIAVDGGYVWQFYMLVPMERSGRRYWLSCVRNVDSNAVRFLPEAGGVTERATLWESLLAIDSLCLFWKDSELRFTGANRAFMDFHGFESATEFIGKTNEQMGWGIFDDNGREYERALIDSGEPVRGQLGNCIVKGKHREIVVYEVPIYDEGERTGLIGLFRVAGEGPEGSASGIFEFVTAINLYVRAYSKNGVDFGLTCVEVVECDGCEQLHRPEFADKIAERFEKLANRIVGNSGMVTRFGQLSFAIAMQLAGEEQKRRLNEQFTDLFSRVESIEGVPCSFEFRAGSATYSEEGSLDKLILAAEQRMHGEKDEPA